MTESELRGTVADELGDEAEQAEVRISPGLAGHVIIEAARETGQDSTQGNGGEHVLDQPKRDFPGIARRVRLIADCPGRRRRPGRASGHVGSPASLARRCLVAACGTSPGYVVPAGTAIADLRPARTSTCSACQGFPAGAIPYPQSG